MKVSKWRATTNRHAGTLVYVTREEALSLVQSLIAQMVENNANSPRTEFYTEEGEYFSIAVTPE